MTLLDRKALALALLSTAASVACGGEVTDDAQSQEADITSFLTIAPNSGCLSTSAGRSGDFRGEHVRLEFTTGELGPMVSVQTYDATTGRLTNVPYEYQYKRVSATELELFYFHTGDRMVPHRLRIVGSGAEFVTGFSWDTTPPVPMKCDLRRNAPSLVLPITQTPAAKQPIAGGFPLPPDRGTGSCVASKLVGGKLYQFFFQRTGVSLDQRHFVHAFAYNPTSHLVEPGLLPGKRASFSDETNMFAWLGTENSPIPNERYAKMIVKSVGGKKQLVVVPEETALKAAIGGEVPVNCDFIGQ